jgi:hypothetical protein
VAVRVRLVGFAGADGDHDAVFLFMVGAEGGITDILLG